MISIPDPNSVTRVADWVELSISVANSSLSRTALTSALEMSGGNEPSETLIASVWHELERRQHLYSRPLYRVEDRTVERETDEQPPEYLACLLLSLYGVQGDTQLPPKLFERLTCEAVRYYLSGLATVFGWPFDPEDRESVEEEQQELQIKRKIRRLAEDLGERFVEAPLSPFKKDRGIDIVGWIPFREKRSGQVVVLLQCAAGHNWVIKRPVPLDAWREYIHWGCCPIIAFSIPCIISERDWHDTSKDNGILFDRVRIVNLLSEGIRDQALNQDLSTWVQQQLANLED
jgi:hypothetical protein